jgi:hypothetical protein
MVGNDPTTIQARCFARLGGKFRNELPREPAKGSNDPYQRLSPTCTGVWIDGIHDGIFELQ